MKVRWLSLSMVVAWSNVIVGGLFALSMVHTPAGSADSARRNSSLAQIGLGVFLVTSLGGLVISRRMREMETSENKLTRILESTTDGVVISTMDGRIVFVNNRIEELFGYRRDQLLGQPVEILMPEGFRDWSLQRRIAQQAHAGKKRKRDRLEVISRHHNGTELLVTVRLRTLATDEGPHFTLFFRDQTQRSRARKALLQAEERYREVLENVQEGIFQATPQGEFITANPALARLLGYASEQELIATTRGFGWQLLVKPEYRTEFRRLLEAQGVVHAYQFQVSRMDGGMIWLSLNARAVRDAHGVLLAMEGMVEDITERKRLEQQFRQVQKMEAVGRLAGGVAHDFNNLVTAIMGYSELLLAELPCTDNAQEYLEEVKAAGERAASLTRQLLAFSRKQVFRTVVLDLNALTMNMDKMLRRLIGEDIELVTLLAPDLFSVKADPGQLEQVLMNLAVNSRDAMEQGGKLTIETANVELDGTCRRIHPEILPGSYVMVAVRDTGSGMDEATMTHMFEPFFTTKEPGKGTGLGLATVYGIIKQSGGYIYGLSEPGQGTTFKIYLPRCQEPVEAVSLPESSAAPAGKETVLLAEDEHGIRTYTRHVLQRYGYQVLVANHGEDALRICEQHEGPIHLLVSDVVMPMMGGRELAQRVMLQRPDMKVLYMSGYTDDTVVRHGVFENETAFLQKPFTSGILVRKVREVLDCPGECPEDMVQL